MILVLYLDHSNNTKKSCERCKNDSNTKMLFSPSSQAAVIKMNKPTALFITIIAAINNRKTTSIFGL